MTRTVHCIYFNETKPGLPKPPFPGPEGEQIFEQVSQEAWQLWLRHQTLLINEKRLNLLEPETQAYLAEQRQKFFQKTGVDEAEGYVPPASG